MAKSKAKYVTPPSLFEKIAEAPQAPEPIMDVAPEPVVEVPEPALPPIEKKKTLEPPTGSVKTRYDEVLVIGDEVTVTDDILIGILKDAHKDKTFIIEKFTPWINCMSGVLVIAAQKDDRTKKTTGIGGKGIDANWFKLVAK